MVPFYYTPRFQGYSLGPSHPFKPIRYRRTHDLLAGYGVFGERESVVEAEPAPEAAIRRAHTAEYVEALKRLNDEPDSPLRYSHGLGPGDTPAFAGVWDATRDCIGGSLQGAEFILSGQGQRAFNVAGGLHHAMANHASGFCVLNDAAIAIHRLLDEVERVAYVDIDAHHGDGVEALFYDNPRVLTVSMHESGEWLFPGTGFPRDTGRGAGVGTALNIPLAPHTGDELFMAAFHEIVPRAVEAFRPDVVVTQFGADAHYSDPLAHLALTTRAYEAMLGYWDRLDLPWLALGGGGYNMDAVPRVWAMVYAAQAKVSLPDTLPQEYQAAWGGETLRDPEPSPAPPPDGLSAEDVAGYARRQLDDLKRSLGWT